MVRLPTVGGDDGTWGTVLNAYLSVGNVVPFSRSGTLTVITGAGRFLFPFDATITGVTAAVNTAPTGASLIFDVNKNGTTIFTTQAGRPAILAGEFQPLATVVPAVTSVVAGDYLSVDIDQVGSVEAGADATVLVLYLPA
jgi:hypothetical protein